MPPYVQAFCLLRRTEIGFVCERERENLIMNIKLDGLKLFLFTHSFYGALLLLSITLTRITGFITECALQRRFALHRAETLLNGAFYVFNRMSCGVFSYKE